ncbi:YopX family protein [Streptococcus suis]|uniref:YopX family protein n=1 Tax=Streptococcus suis TaxID=1307 RepID=UPI0030100A59
MIPKFRVWDKDDEHMYFVAEINLVEELISVDEYDYIFDFSDVVLMQSTGLFDKNGKEIFEGDVVLLRDELNEFESDVYEIVYSRDNLAWIFYDKDSHDFYWMSTCTWDKIEIIGNIYENPELVEEK